MEEISLQQLVSIIRKNIIIVLACTFICGIGTFTVSKFIVPKTYVSTVKLYVSTPNTSKNSTTDINALNYAQKVVNTYIEMLQTNNFYQKVLEKSQISMNLVDFKKMIQFSTLNNTEVFQVKISSRDPKEAKKIADAITNLAPATISQLQEDASLKVVDPADLPDKPSAPNTLSSTIIGFLFGFALSVIFFLVKEMWDVRIKCEEDITQNYSIPVLASIPAFTKEFGKKDLKKEKKKGRR